MDSDNEFSFPDIQNSDEEDKIDDPIQRAQKENGKFLPDSKTIEFEFFGQKVLVLQDAKSCCGGYLWRSAAVLVNYLENVSFFPKNNNSSSFFTNKRIIELGAGTGVVGIALAKLGANVILTDQLSMIDLMKENVYINKLPVSTELHGKEGVSVAELFWGVTNCEPFKSNGGIDYIIASDCIYLEIAFVPLINALLDLCDEKTTIIISYQKRRKADKRFWNLAKKRFHIQEVPKTAYTTNKSEPVQIFHLKKLNAKIK